mmetsp:Transcript_71108/g.113004  ORF Transcript_71108/g.113004 Transcript_71108/m.113004 type:complete len:175 (+) Transcript_71108:72-596(+)|eukprot:CAMPEP_0197057300 /NCGR_PEP_ID=MMETSP1384-20130603/95499_1 /TAXON_ID=29189 /ORGANISM="Ammonia sp." /LENGTH=174 /DNA_ID=CAMNT_0042491673 /DNA_START=47 /DNA_END=571 /DNA_ORIENTATION=-
MTALFLLAALIAISEAANSCVFNLGNKTYDLSPLIAANGSYTWQEMDAQTNISYIFELQLCDAVKTAYPSVCNYPNSGINMIPVKNPSVCYSYGQYNVYSADEAVYKDGLFLSYYHGTMVDNIYFMSTNIYIICAKNTVMSKPTFEHSRTCTDSDDDMALGPQGHFKIFTKYAC